MNYISLNIKYLFDKQNLSEENYGKLFGLGRGAIQSYIIEKATPKIDTIQKITVKYGLTIDEFVNSDISRLNIESRNEPKSYPETETPNIISDSKVTLYTCPECVNKQKEINELTKKYSNLCEELNEVNRKYRELLESKIEFKKENKSANSIQAS